MAQITMQPSENPAGFLWYLQDRATVQHGAAGRPVNFLGWPCGLGALSSVNVLWNLQYAKGGSTYW